MGLESFKTNESEKVDSKQYEHKGEDTIINTEQLKKDGIGGTEELDIIRTDGESDEHYDTKANIAIQLYNIGWAVYVEQQVELDSGEKFVADIIAINSSDTEIDLNIPYTDMIIVEVGNYAQTRAKKALKLSEVVVWVESGGELADAVVIQDIFEDSEYFYFDSKYSHTDSEGNKVKPKLSNLHVNRYKEIAKTILAMTGGISNVDEATQYVNQNTEFNVTNDDMEKILSNLGFI